MLVSVSVEDELTSLLPAARLGGDVVAPPRKRAVPAQRSSVGALFAPVESLVDAPGQRIRYARVPATGSGYLQYTMPTLRCSTCGTVYYSAATDQLLELVLVRFGCEFCDTDEPLQVTDAGVGYLATEPELNKA